MHLRCQWRSVPSEVAATAATTHDWMLHAATPVSRASDTERHKTILGTRSPPAERYEPSPGHPLLHHCCHLRGRTGACSGPSLVQPEQAFLGGSEYRSVAAPVGRTPAPRTARGPLRDRTPSSRAGWMSSHEGAPPSVCGGCSLQQSTGRTVAPRGNGISF